MAKYKVDGSRIMTGTQLLSFAFPTPPLPLMTFSKIIDGVQYFIVQYCVTLDEAQKRIEKLCSKGKNAFLEHIDNDFVVYSSF